MTTINSLYEAYKLTHKRCMIMIRNWHEISQAQWTEHHTFEHMTIRPYVGICNHILYDVMRDIDDEEDYDQYRNAFDVIRHTWCNMHHDTYSHSDWFIAGREEDRKFYYQNMNRLHFLIYLANEAHTLMIKELNK